MQGVVDIEKAWVYRLRQSAERPHDQCVDLGPDPQLFTGMFERIGRTRRRMLQMHDLVHEADREVVALTRVERRTHNAGGAFVSAAAAAATAILAKIGVEGVPSTLATAIRTVVVTMFAVDAAAAPTAACAWVGTKRSSPRVPQV